VAFTSCTLTGAVTGDGFAGTVVGVARPVEDLGASGSGARAVRVAVGDDDVDIAGPPAERPDGLDER
jgi:hypothetical protein